MEPAGRGERLDRFLASPDRLGSRSRARSALERNKVLVNGLDVGYEAAARRLEPGDVVRVWMDRPGSATRRLRAVVVGDLRVLFEDDCLLVVDKPAGLLAVPLERKRGAGSAFDLLDEHLRSHRVQRPLVVHRIDRDTSGLVVFAKTPAAQAHLKAQFLRREPERVYWAVVYGRPEPPEGTWRDRLAWDRTALVQKAAHPRDPRGTEAVCRYKVLERFRGTSLIEVRLHTGKRNQIRIQARLRGHPLVGERRYVSALEPHARISFPRQALHACRLSFRHPRDGRSLSFDAPLPADLAGLLARLRRG